MMNNKNEFLRTISYNPQNKDIKNKPKTISKRFIATIGTISLAVAMALGINCHKNSNTHTNQLENNVVDIIMPEAPETPKPYKTDEEAKKIALREIANKISICLGFEQSEDQRLYTKEITPGNYEIRFEERKEDVDTYGNPTGNKSRYTSLVFNSSQTDGLNKIYKEIMSGGEVAWKAYEKIKKMNIKIDEKGNLFLVEGEPQNEYGYHLKFFKEPNVHEGMYPVTIVSLEVGEQNRDDRDDER